MAKTTTPQLPPKARSLQRRLRAWRTQRRPGMAIPDELWMEAVSLANEYGIKEIAQGLPLDRGALKRHIRLYAEEEAPTFIELRPPQAPSSAEAPVAIVEVTRRDGARMVMRLPGFASLDVASLTASFCEGAR